MDAELLLPARIADHQSLPFEFVVDGDLASVGGGSSVIEY